MLAVLSIRAPPRAVPALLAILTVQAVPGAVPRFSAMLALLTELPELSRVSCLTWSLSYPMYPAAIVTTELLCNE